MTFIASVIAKDGVAVIADSLVTTSKPVLELDDFSQFIDEKKKNNDLALSVEEIFTQFQYKTSHTMDYEEKLFVLDRYTVLTIAGNARINNKKIGQIISEFSKKKGKAGNLEILIGKFCHFIAGEIKAHLVEENIIEKTTFIFTHFDTKSEKAIIYKTRTKVATSEDLMHPDFCFVPIPTTPEFDKIVCGGQNKISELVLFGVSNDLFSLISILAKLIAREFGLSRDNVDDNFIEKIRNLLGIHESKSDGVIGRLLELSLQQALNLATIDEARN